MPKLYTKNAVSMNRFALVGILLVAVTFVSARAQDSQPEAVVTDFLNVYNYTTDKAAQLANAFPDDKHDWRPAEGIRSVREAVLHMASGNYFFASMTGTEIPEGVDPRSLEQSGMDMAEAVTTLRESVSFVQNALNNLSEEELDEVIDMFGNEMTKRQVAFMLGDHAAEHLGQLIAYARMNGVVPPWSQGSN